ncbi:uncharacterized protein BCR38DRAFT_476133 [Pseudomassariella vexata]|uniref:Uncharacterized protein n=1 Tax=Pseudomassariella vexata TaxID=1141098 RepID=A0A1Y2DPZ4_9PEZI|nr:uncharacterized protein BCR38DRAFT_476133 [Pseudomassariella vexata]ORY61362.1 hypothetical protein BCR38DRAFT_476133 [Pseudomassariella vexata]
MMPQPRSANTSWRNPPALEDQSHSQGSMCLSSQENFLRVLEDLQDVDFQSTKNNRLSPIMEALHPRDPLQHPTDIADPGDLHSQLVFEDPPLLQHRSPTEHAIASASQEPPVQSHGVFTRPDYENPTDMMAQNFRFKAKSQNPPPKSMHMGIRADGDPASHGPVSYTQTDAITGEMQPNQSPRMSLPLPKRLGPIQSGEINLQPHSSTKEKQPGPVVAQTKPHKDAPKMQPTAVSHKQSPDSRPNRSSTAPEALRCNQKQVIQEREQLETTDLDEPRPIGVNAQSIEEAPISDDSDGATQQVTQYQQDAQDQAQFPEEKAIPDQVSTAGYQSEDDVAGLPFPNHGDGEAMCTAEQHHPPPPITNSQNQMHPHLSTQNHSSIQPRQVQNTPPNIGVARSVYKSKTSSHGRPTSAAAHSSANVTPSHASTVDEPVTASRGTRRQEARPTVDSAFLAPSPSAAPSRRAQRKAQHLRRPLRNEVESVREESVLRPRSRESNISKQRGISPREHRRLSPGAKQSAENFKMLGNSWNHYFTFEQGRQAKVSNRIDRMEKVIAEQAESIRELENDLDARDSYADHLEGEKNQLIADIEEMETRMQESSSKIKKLDEKCRSYRDRLNEATTEQQALYLKMKNSYQTALAAIREEDQSRKKSTEHALKVSESVRAEIHSKVTSVVNEARQRAEKMDSTITTLSVQLEERNRELSQEKQTIKTLRKELDESRQMNTHNLQTLTSQNEQILKTMQQHRSHAADAEISACKQNENLDLIVKTLNEVKATASDQTAVIAQMRTLKDEGVNSVLEEIQKLASSHSAHDEDKKLLSANLLSIHGMCEGIQQQVNEGQQAAAQWHNRYEEAFHQFESSEEARKEAEEKLEEANEWCAEYHTENEQFRMQVEVLETQVAILQGQIGLSEANKAEVSRLQQLVTEKTAEFAQSDEKVQSLSEQLFAQNGQLNERKAQISHLQQLFTEKNAEFIQSDQRAKALEEKLLAQTNQLKEQDSQARTDRERLKHALDDAAQQQRQAIEQAVLNERTRVQEVQRDTEQRLAASEKSRSQMEQELEKANETIEQLSMGRDSVIEELRSLRDGITHQIQKVNELTSEVEDAGESQNRLRTQLGELAQDRVQISYLETMFQRMQRENHSVLEAITTEKKRLAADITDDQGLTIGLRTPTSTMKGHTGTDISSSPLSEPPSSPLLSQQESQVRTRRVSMKSPMEEEGVLAPSILQERESRRLAQPPRPIIKPTTRSTDSENQNSTKDASRTTSKAQNTPDSVPSQSNTSKSSALTHSSYNRPVLGGLASNGGNSEVEGQRAVQRDPRARRASTREENQDSQEKPPKRQRTSEISHQSGAAADTTASSKMPRSSSRYFSHNANDNDSEIAEEDMSTVKMTSSRLPTVGQRGGPLERPASNLARTYGSQSSQSATSQVSTASTRTMQSTGSQASEVSASAVKSSQSQNRAKMAETATQNTFKLSRNQGTSVSSNQSQHNKAKSLQNTLKSSQSQGRTLPVKHRREIAAK